MAARTSTNRRRGLGAMMALLSVIAVAAAPGASGAVGDELVTNGSFELGYPGDFQCGTFGWYPVGYHPDCREPLQGWTTTGGGVDWQGPFNESPAAIDGHYAVDLIGGGGSATISQAIATTPGASYTLTFSYAAHQWCTANQYAGTPTATAGAGASSLDVSVTLAEGWKSSSLAFTASGATTPISFTGTFAGSCGGVVLDDVSVLDTVVPAPTSADQCKKEGWRAFTNPSFRNQGQCVSFVQSARR